MSGLTALTANYTDSEDEAGGSGNEAEDQKSPVTAPPSAGPLSALKYFVKVGVKVAYKKKTCLKE